MSNENDFQLDIATAHSRLSKNWRNKKWAWSDIVRRCEETKRTSETMAEYLRMPREEQSSIKDVGGFVGGYLTGGSRKTGSVLYRSMATLDIDYGTPDVWETFTENFGCAAIIYSTHKHTAEHPRYRLVIPFSRNLRPDEYEPVCRKITYNLGMDLFDDTTYQLARLFYWPSTSRDGEYFFRFQDGKPLDVDEILSQYVNPQDSSEWDWGKHEKMTAKHEVKKLGDPGEKPGLIGAFCRAYSIEEAIDTFLTDAYEKTGKADRYTYKMGSVAGGLVLYDGWFAYSNHETDPASQQLCNAFDLCRIHLFGAHDEGSRVTDITRLPSYIKMQDFVAADKKVRVLLTKERQAEIATDFDDVDIVEAEADATGEDWMGALEYDRKGAIKPTAKNIISILEHDPRLSGHLWHDLFSGFDLVRGGLPWDREATQWGNRDDANLRIYLDENYGVTGKDKIKDAKEAVLTRHQMHPIRDYLNSLTWDGTPRLERLIIDYIGAEDNELNRAMTRKHFTAAVARVMEPGCKYDYCLIVSGAEGIGKSTLFNIMGGQWFSDSLVTMEGKTGMEQALGGWVIELPELGSIKRSDVEQVKAYISRQDDVYRPAYGTVVERHPRQCVFCGTTNEAYFLKGDTGNRRFWVIYVDASYRKREDFREALTADRDQLWAEAAEYWKRGESLCLPAELEGEARKRQAQFNDDNDDPMKGLLSDFLNMKLPVDWPTWDLRRRRAYLNDPDPLDATGTEERTIFCVAEFICERLGKDMSDKEYRYTARRINKMMADQMGWEKVSSSRHAEALYGRQKAFKRRTEEGQNGRTEEEDEEL